MLPTRFQCRDRRSRQQKPASTGIPGIGTAFACGYLATVVWSGLASFVILKVIDMTVGLRVEKNEEIEGLDINLHGEVVQ